MAAARRSRPTHADVDPFAPAGHRVHQRHHRLSQGRGAQPVQPAAPRRHARGVSRGYGPTLRKGDFLPLTILNMQVLTTLLTAQAGGSEVIMDRIDAAAWPSGSATSG